jgi:hypothetical protein
METLIEYLKTNKPSGFTPKPHYSADGDSLTFYFKNMESYGERVDNFLTVYRAMDTGELVGCQVKGVARALKLLGNFGVCIDDGSVFLGMIFMACLAANPQPEPETRERYLELGRMTQGISMPAEELEPVSA